MLSVVNNALRTKGMERVFGRIRRLSNLPPWNSALVDARFAPTDFSPECAVVYPDFLTKEEGELLVQDIARRMKRRRYEQGHWDAVITHYKEVELPEDTMEDPRLPQILERTRQLLTESHLFYEPISWLPCHAIDLKKEGELNAHVDSVKFSGDLVAGISLLSSSVMRLTPHEDGGTPVLDGHVDLLLPPLSLYVLTGVGRYRYSHELLKDQAIFNSPEGDTTTRVERGDRLSIIFRDSKRE